jgi:thymidylate kinase
MLVVFEGCDKSGKSTLSQKFADATEIPLIKIKMGKSRQFWETHIQAISETVYHVMKCLGTKVDMVLDRFIISDDVYVNVFNREPLDYFKPYEDFKDVIFIYCCPTLETILGRVDREEKIINEQELVKLYNEYYKQFQVYAKHYPVLTLDTGALSIDECLLKATEFYGRNKR